MESGMILLTITAALTSLCTEAVKKTFNLDGKKISFNLLAAVVSVVCALLVSSGYVIIADIAITPKTFVSLVALIILSWLISMLGFDKVTQTIKSLDIIKQIK